jgi:hypothetical protein
MRTQSRLPQVFFFENQLVFRGCGTPDTRVPRRRGQPALTVLLIPGSRRACLPYSSCLGIAFSVRPGQRKQADCLLFLFTERHLRWSVPYAQTRPNLYCCTPRTIYLTEECSLACTRAVSDRSLVQCYRRTSDDTDVTTMETYRLFTCKYSVLNALPRDCRLCNY